MAELIPFGALRAGGVRTLMRRVRANPLDGGRPLGTDWLRQRIRGAEQLRTFQHVLLKDATDGDDRKIGKLAAHFADQRKSVLPRQVKVDHYDRESVADRSHQLFGVLGVSRKKNASALVREQFLRPL